MNWNHLTDLSQLDRIVEESSDNPILIFKHSRSCSISSTALSRLERNWDLATNTKLYLLDLLSFRNISSALAEKFAVQHESPQVLIIENGKSVYDRSHFDITFNDIKSRLPLVEE